MQLKSHNGMLYGNEMSQMASAEPIYGTGEVI